MSKPINLNKSRKDRQRDAKRRESDLNSAKFGRTKAERIAEAARNADARRKLDQHFVEDE